MVYRETENKLPNLMKISWWVFICFLWFHTALAAQEVMAQLPFITIENNGPSHTGMSVRQGQPLLAGYTVLLEKDITGQGVWSMRGHTFIWRIGFHIPGAPALNVYFRDVHFSSTEKLMIYTPGSSVHPELITQQDNSTYYGTDFLTGDSLIIELNTKDKHIPFRISELGVADNTYSGRQRDFGGAGDCEVPVNCAEGENWQQQKNGVARILIKEATNLFWCTGSLVNNTNNDGKPYFLTANHCGEYASDNDYSAWVFYFNYESADCQIPQTEPDKSHKITGARLVAHSKNDVSRASDFKLLLLNREVPDSYHPYYNGWDMSGNVSSSGVTIHHPQGDIMMISTYEVPIVSVNYDDQQPDIDGMYWEVKWAKTEDGYGVTEGGSSGSPLFDAAGLIIGTLTGGEASCSYPERPDFYGKFSYAWESEGADSSNQLKYWLDPMNTGVLSLEGTDLDTTLVRANFSSDVTEITMGEQVQFINWSTGDASGYVWYFEGGSPSYSEEETPPPIKYDVFGTYEVMLVAKSAAGNDTLVWPAYIKVLPMMVPNPSEKGVFRLSFGKNIPPNVDIDVYDIFGRKVSPVFVQEQNNSLYVNISLQAAGAYLIAVKTNNDAYLLKAFYVHKEN